MGNNGSGSTIINIGGAGDTVNISGTLNNVTTTNTQVADKSLVLNSGGAASTAGTSGLYFEEAGDSSNSYMRISSDCSKIELKAPTGSNITLNQSLSNTDAAVFSSVTATTLSASGNVSSSTAPTASSHLTTKAYVDSKITTLSDQNLKTTDDVVFKSVACTNGFSTGAITSTGIVRSSDLTLPNAGGTAYGSTLDFYEMSTFSTPFTGPWVTGSLIFRLARIGKVVTITLHTSPSSTATSASYFTSTTMLPAVYRPTQTAVIPLLIYDNSTTPVMGYAAINLDGSIYIKSLSGNFIGTGFTGFFSFTGSYVIA